VQHIGTLSCLQGEREKNKKQIQRKEGNKMMKKLFVMILAAMMIFSAAACGKKKEPAEPKVMSTFQLEKYASEEELEDAVGFSVEDLRDLPVTISEIQYQAIAGEIAQVIVLYGEDEEPGRIVFRKSAGEDDNSGDYNRYDSERTVEVDGTAVMLKGSEGAAALALWQRDGFTCSMAFDPEVPEDTAAAYLSEIMK